MKLQIKDIAIIGVLIVIVYVVYQAWKTLGAPLQAAGQVAGVVTQPIAEGLQTIEKTKQATITAITETVAHGKLDVVVPAAITTAAVGLPVKSTVSLVAGVADWTARAVGMKPAAIKSTKMLAVDTKEMKINVTPAIIETLKSRPIVLAKVKAGKIF